MASLRIALCQVDVTVGDLEGNAEKVIALIADAEAAGADLAVFPELVLTGYPPEDLLLEPGFVEGNLLALEKVAAATQRCAAVVGFAEEDGDLYNSAALCAAGQVHAIGPQAAAAQLRRLRRAALLRPRAGSPTSSS